MTRGWTRCSGKARGGASSAPDRLCLAGPAHRLHGAAGAGPGLLARRPRPAGGRRCHARCRLYLQLGPPGAARGQPARGHPAAGDPAARRRAAAEQREMGYRAPGRRARTDAAAVRIAASVDDTFAPGTDVSKQAYKVRDDYTSLMWLGGTKALWSLGQPAQAAPLFLPLRRRRADAADAHQGFLLGRPRRPAGERPRRRDPLFRACPVASRPFLRRARAPAAGPPVAHVRHAAQARADRGPARRIQRPADHRRRSRSGARLRMADLGAFLQGNRRSGRDPDRPRPRRRPRPARSGAATSA